MPTATPFTALGVGDGFPSCLVKYDISDLANHPRGYYSVLSLEQAMELYWNMSGITAYAEANFNPGSIYNALSSSDEMEHEVNGQFFTSTPEKRICNLEHQVEKNTSTMAFGYVGNVGVTACSRTTEDGLRNIARLYLGDTSNEENFIGYGVGNFAYAYVDVTNIVNVEVRLNSYGYDYDPVIFIGETYSRSSFTAGSTGIPLHKTRYTYWNGQQNGSPAPFDSEADITGLNFYTYP